MAEHVELPRIPASVAMLPFFFMAPASPDRGWDFQAALAVAAAAGHANTEPRNTLRRIAYSLCELGHQYGRRTGEYGAPMPLSRNALAQALGVGLSRVKRILGLLTLSRVIACDGDTLQVLDWRRLCSAGGYDAARLGGAIGEDEELAEPASDDEPLPALTAAGDPACFV